MADPITIALIAGGALTATSQIQQGRIAEAQGEVAKDISVRNQQALERQRKAELDAASIQEGRVARQEKITKARAVAQQGKSGGQIAGASLSALTDIASQFAIERNLTLRGGMIRGQELRERGQLQLAQGRFAASSGRAAKSASILGAVGTGLTTMATIGGMGAGGGKSIGGTTSKTKITGFASPFSTTRHFSPGAFK